MNTSGPQISGIFSRTTDAARKVATKIPGDTVSQKAAKQRKKRKFALFHVCSNYKLF